MSASASAWSSAPSLSHASWLRRCAAPALAAVTALLLLPAGASAMPADHAVASRHVNQAHHRHTTHRHHRKHHRRGALSTSARVRTAPDTTITSAPPTTTTDANASFAFASSMPNSTFQCSIDGGSRVKCNSPDAFNGLAKGKHTFNVRARDAGGTYDPTPATYSWMITDPAPPPPPPPADTTPPDTTITSSPASTTLSASAAFAFTSTESGSSFSCTLDGGAPVACASPQNYTGLAAGSHTFTVVGTDAAGNTDPTPASYTWTITSSSPSATLLGDTTVEPDVDYTGAGTMQAWPYSATASGSAGSVAVYLDASSTTNNLTVAIYADNTGHPGNLLAQGSTATLSPGGWNTVTLGTHPAVSSGSRYWIALLTTSNILAYRDDLTGACTSYATGGSLTSAPSTWGTDIWQGQTCPLSAHVIAGTSGGGTPTPPDTTITSSPASSTTATSASFGFTSTASGSSFKCSLDGAQAAACSSPKSYSALAAGSHSFTVAATDAAGTTDPTPASFTWTITSSSPPPSGSDAGNLWIDTDGGTCTRQATAGAYATAQACGSFSSALRAAQPGDTILVRCASGTSCTFPPEDLSGDRGASANVVIAAATGYTVGFEETAGSGRYVWLNDLHHVTFRNIGFGHNNVADSSPNLRVDCTRDVTLINSSGRRFYMFEGNANVTFQGGDWGGYSSPGEEDSTMGTTGAYGPARTCPGDSGPKPQSNIVFDGVTWHDVFYLSSCTFVNGGQCSEWGGAHPDCFEINGYVDGVTVKNSTFSHCGNTMLSLYTDQGQINNVVVDHNTFTNMSDDTYFGIQWVTTANFTCSGNQFTNNTYTPNAPGAWIPNAPPRFECKTGAVPTLVSGNTIQAAPPSSECTTSKNSPYLTSWRSNTFGAGSC